MDPLIEGFKKLASAAICEALDRLGVHGLAQRIAPLWMRPLRTDVTGFRPSGEVPIGGARHATRGEFLM